MPDDADSNPWDFLGAGETDSGTREQSRVSRPTTTSDIGAESRSVRRTRTLFESDDSGPAIDSSVRTPYGWIVAAAACGALSLCLGSVAHGRFPLALLGWIVGGLCSIGLLTVFTIRDGRLRAGSWYVQLRWPDRARPVVILLAAVGVGLNAWWIADIVSRSAGA